MYKLTKPDGFDFYSGTINYRNAIGTIIRVTDYDPPEIGACGRGLHASRNPNNCFVGAKIPCAAFRVKGIQPITRDNEKTRYRALKVLEEITDLNLLFGWNYTEAINPIDPFKIKPPEITEKEIALLKEWTSVRAFVWDSVRDFVWTSVGDSLRDFVWASVWTFVWDSVGDSVGDSVWDSVNGYVGSLFTNIKKWKYVEHKKGEYLFQSVVDLWKMGLIPSFDGEKWKLHGGKKAGILWEGTVDRGEVSM